MHADEARAIGEGGRRDLVRVRVRVGVRLGLTLTLVGVRLGFEP